MSRGGVVGFDLDLTLADTRVATGLAARDAAAAVGAVIEPDEFAARIGPPLSEEFGRYISSEDIPTAIELFRKAFLERYLERVTQLSGASEVLSAVIAAKQTPAVITSRIDPIAKAILEQCNLSVPHVVGAVSGRGKAPVLIELGATAYVGDHLLDMEGAVAAGVLAVGVTTGSHDRRALVHGGADIVVESLVELVPWPPTGRGA